jgi:dipeptidyl aminopeptidase/acylaminoacyl peptidase
MMVDTRTTQMSVALRAIHPLHVEMSPDHKTLVLATLTEAQPESYLYSQSVTLLDLQTLQRRTILQEVTLSGASGAVFSWSPDGQFLTVPDERPAPTAGGVANKFSDLMVIDVTDGSVRRIRGDDPETVYYQTTPVWTADGKAMSFIRADRLETWSVPSLILVSKASIHNRTLLGLAATEDRVIPVTEDQSLVVTTRDPQTKKEGFWRVWSESARTRLGHEDDVSLGPFDYAFSPMLTPDGLRVVFRSESVDHAPGLYAAGINGGDVKGLTETVIKADLAAMGHSKIVSWTNEDGHELRGSVLLPPNYEPNRKYPMLVSLYPTDGRVDLVNRFGMEQAPQLWNNWQLYASRGFVVFEPDVQLGASGREFMSDIAKSVVPGIGRMVSLGIADPKRVGCVGISAGGYATLALLVQSKVCQAAIVLNGVSDMLDLFSYGNGRRIVGVHLGADVSVWKDREVLIANSPYFFLDRLSVPLLILQGTDDAMVPRHQSDKVFSGLASLGKDAVYVEYAGEGHGFDLIEHRLDVFHRAIQWFHEHLEDAQNTRE